MTAIVGREYNRTYVCVDGEVYKGFGTNTGEVQCPCCGLRRGKGHAIWNECGKRGPFRFGLWWGQEGRRLAVYIGLRRWNFYRCWK